ncbi:MAG: HAD family phosphatase [Candidatus Woesearchaeota archaeon]
MRTMAIKAVIFDMDGVLVDSMKYHIISWKKALNTFYIHPTNEELALLEGMQQQKIINALSQKYSKHLTKKEKEEIYTLKKKIINDIFSMDIYPHVLDLLKALKRSNLRLAVVSGADKQFVSKIIKKFEGFFEVIITGDDVTQGKPYPEPYLKALERLKLDCGDVIVIENAPLGIESSKNANIETFAIATTLNKKCLRKADKIFSSHLQLLKYFTKIL